MGGFPVACLVWFPLYGAGGTVVVLVSLGGDIIPSSSSCIFTLLIETQIQAFWHLGKGVVESTANIVGITVSRATTLFDTLWHVIKTNLSVSDDKCLEIISQRFESPTDEMANGAILDVDEAVQVLDKDDVDEMKGEQKAEQKRATAKEVFAKKFGEKRREVDLFALEQKSKNEQKKQRTANPNAVQVLSFIGQKTAKLFLPQEGTCSIWKASRGEWCGHCPPYKRVHSPFDLHGGEGALHNVLQMLWKQHCRLRGLEYPNDCPHAGLITAGATQATDDRCIFQMAGAS